MISMSLEFVSGRDDIAYDLSAVGHISDVRRCSPQVSFIHKAHSVDNIIDRVCNHVSDTFDDRRTFQVWHRYDVDIGNFRTSLKDGPSWRDVCYRATCRLSGQGECIVEPADMIPRNKMHSRLPWDRSSVCTVLLYLPDRVFREGSRHSNELVAGSGIS